MGSTGWEVFRGPLGTEGWDSQCFSAAATLSDSRFGVKPHHSPHRGTFCHFLAHQNKMQTPQPPLPPHLSLAFLLGLEEKVLPTKLFPTLRGHFLLTQSSVQMLSPPRGPPWSPRNILSLPSRSIAPFSFLFLYCTYPCMKLSFLFIILTWFIGSVSP